MIVAYYVETRKSAENPRTAWPSPRSLEALSRLAEASARIRLSESATADDAKRAIRLTKTWRHELMGENFDMTTIESGKKGRFETKRKPSLTSFLCFKTIRERPEFARRVNGS